MVDRFAPELKVILVSFTGIVSSYIGYSLSGLDWLRVLVLIITLAYTIRRWYLMEKRNKNYKNKKQKDEKNN